MTLPFLSSVEAMAPDPSPSDARWFRRVPAGWLFCSLLILAACSSEDGDGLGADLPVFSGSPLKAGALLCLTGPASARAPDLERTAILAEEFVNGSTRAYEGERIDIPCRLNDNCGMWVGRDVSGLDLRGPLELIVGDDGDRADVAAEAALRLRADHDIAALISGCSPDAVEAVFREATGTDLLLVTPLASADSITALPDRTEEESANAEPGWVYRTVTPDYVVADLLRVVGQNEVPSRPLVRFEDQTETRCTSDDECAAFGDDFSCRASTQFEVPEREFVTITDVACAGRRPDFCSDFGLNYVCEPVGEGPDPVCAQFRPARFCTREVSPRTAMVLYEDSASGRALRDDVRASWQSRADNFVLAEVAYDPAAPESFVGRVSTVFQLGSAEFRRRQREGEIDEAQEFGDSVVFLFADAVSGSLLLQEWSAQLGALGVEGAERVFWLGTDRLRSRILTNQLNHETIRNLYIVSSAVLDTNNGLVFEDFYRRRWGAEPPDFAANLFDAVLLLALANERAANRTVADGLSGALDPATPQAIKNAFPAVAGGCHRPSLDDSCVDIVGDVPTTIRLSRFANAMGAARAGRDIAFSGVTGNLEMSPEGDRISQLALYKVEPASGGKGRFYELERFTPQVFGINFR